jgi:hypothetical protein
MFYDMRLVRHEDGWIYGLFCTERKDPGVIFPLLSLNAESRGPGI